MLKQDLSPNNNNIYNFFPEKSRKKVKDIIESSNFNLEFTTFRKSNNRRFGVFISKTHETVPTIKISKNLGQYTTLLVFIHEYAHYVNWCKNKHKVKPHGKEWKMLFFTYLMDFINDDIFPSEIKKAISEDVKKCLGATIFSNEKVVKAVMLFEDIPGAPKDGQKIVEDVEIDEEFSLSNGIRYKMIKKRRKNGLCKNLSNNKLYLVPLKRIALE